MKAQEKLYDLHELCLNIVNRSDDFETLLGEFLDQEENDTINETAKAALALINNADAEDPDPLLIDNYAKKLQEMISTSKVRRKTIKNINSMVEEAGGLQTSGKHGTGSNLTLADIYKIAKLKASEKGEEKKGEFDVLLKEYNELLSNYLVHTGKTEGNTSCWFY